MSIRVVDDEGPHVKMEMESPRMGKRERKKRIVRRLVERPKTVYERFPTFEKDKILDFTELFKGYTVHKSRLSKRPIQSETTCSFSNVLLTIHSGDILSEEEDSTRRVARVHCRRDRETGRESTGRTSRVCRKHRPRSQKSVGGKLVPNYGPPCMVFTLI